MRQVIAPGQRFDEQGEDLSGAGVVLAARQLAGVAHAEAVAQDAGARIDVGVVGHRRGARGGRPSGGRLGRLLERGAGRGALRGLP